MIEVIGETRLSSDGEIRMSINLSNKRKACIMTIAMVTLLGLSGCSNTLEGIGRDVENAGEKIQDTF